MTPEQMAALFGRSSQRNTQTQGSRDPRDRRRQPTQEPFTVGPPPPDAGLMGAAPRGAASGSGATFGHPESPASGQGGGGGRSAPDPIREILDEPSIFDPEEAMRYASLFDIIGDTIRIPTEHLGWAPTRAEQDIGGERAQSLAEQLAEDPRFREYQQLLSAEQGLLSPETPRMLGEAEANSVLGTADQLSAARTELASALRGDYPLASDQFLQAAASGTNLPPLDIPDELRDPVGFDDIGEGIMGFLQGGEYEPQSGANLIERLAYEGLLEPPVARFLQLAAIRRAGLSASENIGPLRQRASDAWNELRGSPDLPPELRGSIVGPEVRQRARAAKRRIATTPQPMSTMFPHPSDVGEGFGPVMGRPNLVRFWGEKGNSSGRIFDLSYAYSLHPELLPRHLESLVRASEEAGEAFLPWLSKQTPQRLERLGLNSRDANILVQNAADTGGLPDLALSTIRRHTEELNSGSARVGHPFEMLINGTMHVPEAERAGLLARDLRISEEAAEEILDRAERASAVYDPRTNLDESLEAIREDPAMFASNAAEHAAQRNLAHQQQMSAGRGPTGSGAPPGGGRTLNLQPGTAARELSELGNLGGGAGGDDTLGAIHTPALVGMGENATSPYHRQIRYVDPEVFGGARWNPLRRDIPEMREFREKLKAEGVEDPVIVIYDPEKGVYTIGEGNHRIAAAKALGEPVPVRTWRASIPDNRPGLRTEPLPAALQADEYGYVNQAIPADQLGFPVYNADQLRDYIGRVDMTDEEREAALRGAALFEDLPPGQTASEGATRPGQRRREGSSPASRAQQSELPTPLAEWAGDSEDRLSDVNDLRSLISDTGANVPVSVQRQLLEASDEEGAYILDLLSDQRIYLDSAVARRAIDAIPDQDRAILVEQAEARAGQGSGDVLGFARGDDDFPLDIDNPLAPRVSEPEQRSPHRVPHRNPDRPTRPHSPSEGRESTRGPTEHDIDMMEAWEELAENPRDPFDPDLNLAGGGGRFTDSMSDEFRQAVEEYEAKRPQGGREGSDAPNMIDTADEGGPLVDDEDAVRPGDLEREDNRVANALNTLLFGNPAGPGDPDDALRLFNGMTDEDAALTFNQIADEGAPLAEGIPRRVPRDSMLNLQSAAQENALRATDPESQRRWVLLGREMNNLPPRPEAEQVMAIARRLGFNPEELETLRVQFNGLNEPVFRPGELTGQTEAATALEQARIRSGEEFLDEATGRPAPEAASGPRTVGLDTDEGIELADRWRMGPDSAPFAEFVDGFLREEARGKRLGALTSKELESLGPDTLMGGQIDTDGFGPTKFAIEGSEGTPELVRIIEMPPLTDLTDSLASYEHLEETLSPIRDAAFRAGVPVEIIEPADELIDALSQMGFRKRSDVPVWRFTPRGADSVSRGPTRSPVTYLSQRSA